MRTLFVAVLSAFLSFPGAVRAETLYFIHVDHLNTPRLAVSEDSWVHWRWEQAEPFGENPAIELMGTEGYLTNLPLRFPGQYADKETNAHYNMARDYDPAIGRYIQSDPIGLQGGINTYAYVASNPLSYMDPEGLQIRIPRPKIPGFPGTSSGGGRSSDSTGSRELDEALGIPHPSGASSSASSSSSSSSSGGQTLEECYAQCEEDQKERDALCYSLKYMRDKSKQAQCLRESFEKTVRCYTECRKICK